MSKVATRDKASEMKNRHALPNEVKDIVKPRMKIPLERRDSFTLLKRQIEKGGHNPALT